MAQLNILVADDDFINFRVLELILQNNLDCLVYRASNGYEAWEQADTIESLDCILMDMRMPIMDGFTATKKIKEKHPNLPIIAVTAYAWVGDREKVLAAGCDAYIAKPVDNWELLTTIKKFTQKKE